MKALSLIAAAGLLALPSAGLARDRATPVAPKNSPGGWFPPSAYPVEAKRRGEQGTVSIELTIDPSGTPTVCRVTASSGASSLDRASCELARANGRFIPAKDARGRPVEATYAVPGIRWALYDDATPPAGVKYWFATNYPRDDSSGGWFRQSDYPAAARKNRLTGKVVVQAAVSTSGLPTSCWIVESSGVPDLDEATCVAVLRRGKWTPAKDRSGNPIGSTYLLPPVRWEPRD